MAFYTARGYFLALASIALVLLWGVSLWNGTVKGLILATWHGQFEDGTPLKTNYTGIFCLDFPLSLLVAFFFYGTSGLDRGYQLFLIDAYSSLQPAFVWLYIESARPHAKPSVVANPIIWGLLWQAFGAAISLPLYYYHHLKWLDEKARELDSASLPSARALPISFIVGALLPAILGMPPTWIHRSALSHQNILAAWQPDPVWVSLIQASAVAIFSRYSFGPDRDGKRAAWWTRASFLIAAVSSAAGHLYVLSTIMLTRDPMVGFKRMYVPISSNGPGELNKKLASGPWLFLQYDLIIIALSSLSWAYLLVDRLLANNFSLRKVLWLGFFFGGLVLGPGATVSLALFWREGKLEQRRAAMRLVSKSHRTSGL